MLYWDKYNGHKSNIVGKRKKVDNNIYTFDIETTSYLVLNDKVIPANNYLDLNENERESSSYMTTMYIWMFGINNIVYYGRTWAELKCFLKMVDKSVPEKKIIFIHNLAFEFQFLKSQFHFKDVTARKSHKVMTAFMADYNFMLKCSYIMSNCALKELPKLFKLPVEKMVGDLDYSVIRHNETPLTDKELGYCEHDCLVVYYYIMFELDTYERVDKIPTTSTGHVRRELMNLTYKDFKYRRLVNKSINTNPHVYNLLVSAFAGGFTHANWIYTDEVIKNIDSYDETSAYPYVLVAFKFPSKEFKKCYNLETIDEMDKHFAYLLTVTFKNIKCKYYNNFISRSKCSNIVKGKYDNGRVIEAEELTITLTDIDFRFILDTYTCNYHIEEAYYSLYNYLPKLFINFVLEKYVNKTKFKNVEDMELEYQKEKNKFNALYGMSVTNNIRDTVKYLDDTLEWIEEELTNDEIVEKLLKEKKKSFLNFATGVWVTAYARDNLLRRVIALDEYVVYCDTDSCKLIEGYDKNVFVEYNKKVEEKIKKVSSILGIDFNKYAPVDSKGKAHLLGVFEYEGQYQEFITQGAKKYAVKEDNELKITVAGVPKSGAKALHDLNEFRDDFVFRHEDTNKNLLIYCEGMLPTMLTDYLGNTIRVLDKTGCSIIPTTYVLGKSEDYCNLISDESSKRSIYKE